MTASTELIETNMQARVAKKPKGEELGGGKKVTKRARDPNPCADKPPPAQKTRPNTGTGHRVNGQREAENHRQRLTRRRPKHVKTRLHGDPGRTTQDPSRGRALAWGRDRTKITE
ncbi:hypothetical protein CHUAL_011364 [Chamberlinius hualienensis]